MCVRITTRTYEIVNKSKGNLFDLIIIYLNTNRGRGNVQITMEYVKLPRHWPWKWRGKEAGRETDCVNIPWASHTLVSIGIEHDMLFGIVKTGITLILIMASLSGFMSERERGSIHMKK